MAYAAAQTVPVKKVKSLTTIGWGGANPFNPPPKSKAYDPNAPALAGYNQPPAGNNTAVPVGGTNGSLYNSADANYIRNIPTGYTPEQMLAMRNRATNTAAAGTAGSNRRVAEMMAAQGLGGSGAAIAAQAGNMRSANRDLTAALSDQDIANANAGLQGGFQKAGLLNQLMGTGLNENQLAQQASQFNTSTGNDMYKWGSEQDYGRYRDTQSDQYYRDQLALMKQQLGL